MSLWIGVPVVILAIVLRVLSVSWNTFPHADVSEDAHASATFLQTGSFIVEDQSSLVPGEPQWYDTAKFGGRLLTQHPFLWPLLGSSVTALLRWEPTMESTYAAFRLMSLLTGLGVLALTFFLTRKLLNQTAALTVTAWLAFSYLMIDYSGNGAFYSLQACLYLLWIWMAYRTDLRGQGMILGLIAGVAYITNFQSAILMPATFIVLALDSKRSRKEQIIQVGNAMAVFLLLAIPWHVRDYLTFGDAFFSGKVNGSYVLGKAGIEATMQDGFIRFPLTWDDRFTVLEAMFGTWLPNNLYYIARKLFILLPVAFLFFPYALIDYVFEKSRRNTLLPLLIILILHILLSALWPVTKFRYFVPMLPLVAIVCADQLWHLRSALIRKVALTLTTVCIVFFSYLTFRSTPTHTYYYDGAITTDPFSTTGELDYLNNL